MNRLERKRGLSALVCALLVLSMASSLVFIVRAAGHDCIGDGCLTCLRIDACLRVLRLLGEGAVASLLGLAMIRLLHGAAVRRAGLPRHITPVTLKVKLTD